MKFSASKREATGTSAAKQLRRENKVPGVIYANGMDPVMISMDEMDVEEIDRELGQNSVFQLDVDGEVYRVFLREISRSALKPIIYNVNLQAIKAGEKLTMNLPISVINEDQLANPDAVVSLNIFEIEVRIDPDKAPDSIEVDVSGMDIGDTVTISELKFAGMEDADILESDPEEVVVSVNVQEVHTEESEEAEEAAEPEVITEKAEETAE